MAARQAQDWRQEVVEYLLEQEQFYCSWTTHLTDSLLNHRIEPVDARRVLIARAESFAISILHFLWECQLRQGLSETEMGAASAEIKELIQKKTSITFEGGILLGLCRLERDELRNRVARVLLEDTSIRRNPTVHLISAVIPERVRLDGPGISESLAEPAGSALHGEIPSAKLGISIETTVGQPLLSTAQRRELDVEARLAFHNARVGKAIRYSDAAIAWGASKKRLGEQTPWTTKDYVAKWKARNSAVTGENAGYIEAALRDVIKDPSIVGPWRDELRLWIRQHPKKPRFL